MTGRQIRRRAIFDYTAVICLINVYIGLTHRQAVTGYAEVLQPGQPVHDAGQVHQQSCEDLQQQHSRD